MEGNSKYSSRTPSFLVLSFDPGSSLTLCSMALREDTSGPIISAMHLNIYNATNHEIVRKRPSQTHLRFRGAIKWILPQFFSGQKLGGLTPHPSLLEKEKMRKLDVSCSYYCRPAVRDWLGKCRQWTLQLI